jgi:hypothetical protein
MTTSIVGEFVDQPAAPKVPWRTTGGRSGRDISSSNKQTTTTKHVATVASSL